MPELRASMVVALIASVVLLEAACRPAAVIVPSPTGSVPTGSGDQPLTPSPEVPPLTPIVPPTGGPPQPAGGILKLIEDSDGMTMATDATGTLHVATATTVDASGTIMVVYATCTSRCTDTASWSSVPLAVTNPGHVPTIALTADGRPRIAYYTVTGALPGLHYLHCDAACLDVRSWQDLLLGNQFSSTPWPRPQLPFAVSPSGAAAYADYDAAGVELLYCAANCADGNAWSVQPLVAQSAVPESLAFGPDESLQLTARQRTMDTESLVFMDCPANCGGSQSWAGVSNLWRISGATNELQALIDRTVSGSPRIAVYADDPATPQVERVFAYLACDADCRMPTNWAPALLPPIAPDSAGVGYSFMLDSTGNPVIAFASDAASGVSRCSANCATTSGPWVTTPNLAGSDLDANYPVLVPALCLSGGWFMYTGPALTLAGDQPMVAMTASSKAFGGDCGTGSTAIETSSFVVFP